ncbi:MAG TPA: hypothetical protein DIS75_02045, partial [Chryseobacterium sp.]|nr:hypothetical protein [Chryseobacterium sp.]
MTETIVLGGGCFWCIEAVFLEVEGVSAPQLALPATSVPMRL